MKEEQEQPGGGCFIAILGILFFLNGFLATSKELDVTILSKQTDFGTWCPASYAATYEVEGRPYQLVLDPEEFKALEIGQTVHVKQNQLLITRGAYARIKTK